MRIEFIVYLFLYFFFQLLLQLQLQLQIINYQKKRDELEIDGEIDSRLRLSNDLSLVVVVLNLFDLFERERKGNVILLIRLIIIFISSSIEKVVVVLY